MKIQNVALSYLAGSSSAFFLSKKPDSQRPNTRNGLSYSSGGFNDAGLMLTGMNNQIIQQQNQQQNTNSDNENENSDNQITTPQYNRPIASGALSWIQRSQGARNTNTNSSLQKGRSGNLDESDLIEVLTPASVIQEGHEDNIMILSSDYMYVSNCLLKGKNHDNPIRQQAFDLFKQTAAGDWFLVFGYVCELDYRCWKKSVTNLLEKKGLEYGGSYIGRCVSKLVKEKAEGLRTRRKRRSIEKVEQQLSISNNQ